MTLDTQHAHSWDLPENQYEQLMKLAKDDEFQSAFCEFNADDFYLWLAEKGIHHDYACDCEVDYVEAHEEDYLEFVYQIEKRSKVGA